MSYGIRLTDTTTIAQVIFKLAAQGQLNGGYLFSCIEESEVFESKTSDDLSGEMVAATDQALGWLLATGRPSSRTLLA